jgi:hypothetical protein
MSDDVSPQPKLLDQILPGLGIGLLVGLLVGLSVSPVVQGLLTTLGGLLAAMLGIEPTGEGGTPRIRVNGARIGSFGFACVLGILFGMVIRVNDVIVLPVRKQVANWVDAGFDPKEARDIVAFLKMGRKGVDNVSGKMDLAEVGDLQKGKMSNLFSALSDVNLCEKVKLDQFGSDAKKSTEEMLDLYHRLNLKDTGDKRTPLYQHMDELASRLEKLPVETQTEVLKSVEEMVCAIQEIE